jgi:hypothetical protein
LISSYGFINLINLRSKWKTPAVLGVAALWIFFSFFSWDFYLNHYPRRAVVVRQSQAGYRDLTKYISENYNKFNKFYITKKNGQPYIFTLFYLKYAPSKYQKEASLTAPDDYGFGQVEKFDKFDFNFKNPLTADSGSTIIGYPDDFIDTEVDMSNIKKIVVGQEEIFWIYEKH